MPHLRLGLFSLLRSWTWAFAVAGRCTRSSVALAVLSSLALPAAAQDRVAAPAPRILVGVVGGSSTPTSHLRDYTRIGWHVGVSLQGRLPTRWLALRGELTHLRLGASTSYISGCCGSFSTTGTPLNLTSGSASVLAYFPVGRSVVRPYALGGVSTNHLGGLTVLARGGEWRTREWHSGLHGGGGLDIVLGRVTALAEARYLSVPKAHISTRVVPVSVGVRFAP